MSSAIAASVGGAVVGGLMNKGNKGGGSQTTSSEPWGPVQPWLESQIKDGQALEQFYQQNPFNAIQQQGYQNQLGDLDFFRQSFAPQLMGLANKQIGTNYQRAPAGSELGGLLSSIDASQFLPPGQRQSAPQGGLLAAFSQAQGMSPLSAGMSSQGLLGQSGQQSMAPDPQQGVFQTKPLQVTPNAPQQGGLSVPQGQAYGQIDWARMNPFSEMNNPKPVVSNQPTEETWEQIVDRVQRQREAGMGWQPGYGDM